MEDLNKLDLYDILGVVHSSTIQEIKKGYRKKALKCHPDKNPDNADAAKLFHLLTRALEVLIDERAKAAYDKVLNARKAAQIRDEKLDSVRKKFKDELEARERAAETGGSSVPKSDEQNLKEQIDRLRREGCKQLQEEIDAVRKQIAESLMNKHNYCRLQIRWNATKNDISNGGYNAEKLRYIFNKYGTIDALVMSKKKKGRALIAFANKESASSAVMETGFNENPLIVSFLVPDTNKTENVSKSQNFGHFSASNPTFSVFGSAIPRTNNNSTISDNKSVNVDKFEEDVLKMLQKAQEKKILAQQMQDSDKPNP